MADGRWQMEKEKLLPSSLRYKPLHSCMEGRKYLSERESFRLFY
jgi:hypothetical protein